MHLAQVHALLEHAVDLRRADIMVPQPRQSLMMQLVDMYEYNIGFDREFHYLLHEKSIEDHGRG
jgi:hypothetical protein